MRCAVKNCNKKIEGPDHRAYKFPTNPIIRKQWLKFCGRSDKFDTKSRRVCNEHFKTEDFKNNMQYEMGFAMRRLLKHGAVPSINTANIRNMELYKEREERKEKRENKKLVALLLKEYKASEEQLDDKTLEQINEIEEEKMFEPTTQLDDGEDPLNENVLPNLNIEEDCIKILKTENESLRKENRALKLAYAAELKAKEEKIEKIARIYDYNLDELNKRLIKANNELTNLEESLADILTKDQITKLKQASVEL